MLCYVTPKEHLGLPEPRRRQGRRDRLQDRRPRRRPGQGAPRRAGRATTRSPRPASSSAGRTSSTSRSIPRRARAFHDETLPAEGAKVAHFCSMCGPQFCSMKITEDVREYAAKQGVEEEPGAGGGDEGEGGGVPEGRGGDLRVGNQLGGSNLNLGRVRSLPPPGVGVRDLNARRTVAGGGKLRTLPRFSGSD